VQQIGIWRLQRKERKSLFAPLKTNNSNNQSGRLTANAREQVLRGKMAQSNQLSAFAHRIRSDIRSEWCPDCPNLPTKGK
jgi:hypothetical protein